MKTFLLVLAIYSYGEDNGVPFVADSFDTEAECNLSLANMTTLGYSFVDGYELGNTVEKDTEDALMKAFCVEVPE